MNSNIKSAEVLKQEVFTQLDKIDTDIDEMQQRMTPGQMIDDVIYYPRGGNPAATFDMLKANPVGATFLTLGTLLLMEDENHVSYETLARSRVSGVVGKTRSTTRDAIQGAHERMDQIKGGISSVKDRIQNRKQDASELVQNLKSKVSSAKENLSAKISGAPDAEAIIARDGASSDFSSLSEAERAKTINDARAAFGEEESSLTVKAEGLKEKVSDKVSGVTDQINVGAVKDAFASVSDEVGGKVQQGVEAVKNIDPMTYVAIGAGLGTLTGIGLPVPESEQAMVDRMDQKISAFSQDLQNALNESADILKDLVISDFKNINVGIFKR